jgi:S-DNA-T family DNA segregation ATPase FtsK/SpoIIIE
MQKGAASVKNQKGDNESSLDADEELMMVAAELGLKQKQLSASNLQRKLKLGYSRAARIIDKLEEIGFLTEADGSKPRQVLMTEAEWIAYNSSVEEYEDDDDDIE